MHDNIESHLVEKRIFRPRRDFAKNTRIRRVIFGCTDPFAGAAGSVINLLQTPGFNHRCDIASGVLQDECAAILRDFFRTRREEPDPDSP